MSDIYARTHTCILHTLKHIVMVRLSDAVSTISVEIVVCFRKRDQKFKRRKKLHFGNLDLFNEAVGLRETVDSQPKDK